MSLLQKSKAKFFIVVTLFVFGCAGREPLPPCPKVFIEKDTASLTSFGNGEGKDITDQAFIANLDSYTGSCTYSKKRDNVDVTINPEFIVELGASATSNTVNTKYFTAIPEFFPNPNGKFVHDVSFEFPEGITKTKFRGEPVTISIPLKDGKTGPDYNIYIGMQLTKEQLEYNRQK
jgi:hypothetical protein